MPVLNRKPGDDVAFSYRTPAVRAVYNCSAKILPHSYNSCSRLGFWPVHSYATGKNGNGARQHSRTKKIMPAEAWADTFCSWQMLLSGTNGTRGTIAGEIQEPQLRGHMAGQGSGRIDDTLLVREAQRGNRAAFEELVRHYDQAVLRLAMHLTGIGARSPGCISGSVPQGV